MEIAQFEGVKALVLAASASQIIVIERLIYLAASQNGTELALARRTDQTIRTRCCPHCSSNNVVLHGTDHNKRQRFKCRGCRRTYNIMTGTSMARARKPNKWAPYLRCMTLHMPIREIVKTGIGLNHVTVWRWRHRFLIAAANDNAATLSGVIEVDQTFFPLSFKGSRGWTKGTPPDNCEPRRNGRAAMPREQVPVLTAVASDGAVYQAILKLPSGIEAALSGRIAAGSVLCSDASPAYVAVADRAIVEHYVVRQPVTDQSDQTVITQARRSERLGLKRVNSHHEGLRYLIEDECFGVATKYLGNYLGWHRAMIKPGFKGKALLDRALALEPRTH